ncbi:hypothetical protein, unlikely [Trypanosoma brucei gambiense DAL972]|uniref:T. brucei spp.-specific protein n=1 Tax=Trypanosoma brucei gambiense (strain MHOM/CI/86/DAL972) TaxID=679716 RepID=C9ZKN1_TRYB9|nr:hypothetical protein, unlikely [Trypanosoma brucei gambiense DAL972]CBH10247.1 hypothetical protein, unlikely [Trypanosoma brucei gambiense DAL972]|eukprot:XP_011772537.1 hypothetical protein, unlikely [Trypanosoma brucei gambiense DAL972]
MRFRFSSFSFSVFFFLCVRCAGMRDNNVWGGGWEGCRNYYRRKVRVNSKAKGKTKGKGKESFKDYKREMGEKRQDIYIYILYIIYNINLVVCARIYDLIRSYINHCFFLSPTSFMT